MRGWAWLSVVLFAGCGPVEAVLTDPADIGSPDTNADADTDSDSDSDADSDADTDADTEPQMPEGMHWAGTRHFVFSGDACTEDVVETGVNITLDPQWADAVASCGQCDAVFLVDMDKDRICTVVPLAQQVLRGIQWTAPDFSTAMVYRIDYDDQSQIFRPSEIAPATALGNALSYAYQGEFQNWDFDVTATATITP